MVRYKNKKIELKHILIISIVFVLILGYAYIHTNINITGTAGIKKNTWYIHFANLNVIEGSVNANPTISDNEKEIEYDINFKEPGDFLIFTVDVKNDGTIDGMIEKVENSFYNEAETQKINLPNYLDYSITYDDDTEIEKDHILEVDDFVTYRVMVEYKKDIEKEDLPTPEKSLKELDKHNKE